MLRPLRLLNLLLGLVTALIGVALVKTWVAPVAPAVNPGVTKPSQEAEALAYNPVARPPLAQFEVLLEKNPFKQPPPRPVGLPGHPPPPPIPLPSLVGTMLVDHERKAILSDRGKASIYSVGQEVAGGVIVDIKEDRIIYKRGDTTQEIILKGAITSSAATAAPPTEGPPDAAANSAREERLRRREIREQRR